MNIYEVVNIIIFLLMLLAWIRPVKGEKLYTTIAILLTFLILGFRGIDVGGDTYDYVTYFLGKTSKYDSADFEEGYIFINNLLASISKTSFWFIFSTSLLTMVPFYYLVAKTKGNKLLPLCVYMCMWQILGASMTSIRQNIGIGFAITALIIFEEKPFKRKVTNYIVIAGLLLISLTCHSTMYFAIPLLILCHIIRFTKKSAIIAIVICFSLPLLVNNLASELFTMAYWYFGSLDVGHIDFYYQNAQYAMQNINFNSMAPHALLVCTYIYLSDKEELNSIRCKSLIVGECLYLLGSAFPLIFRIVLLLLMIGITFSPMKFKASGGDLRVKAANFLIIALIIFNINLRFSVYSNYDYSIGGGGGRMLPYTFIWE